MLHRNDVPYARTIRHHRWAQTSDPVWNNRLSDAPEPLWKIAAALLIGAALLILANNVGATGNGPPAGPSATATAGAFAGATAAGGAGGAGGIGGTGGIGSTGPVTQSVETKALGGGGTGLTGSADCLQSAGVFFNFVSFTWRDGDCLAKNAGEAYCKTDECKKQIECQDKDLPQYAKDAIGCPKAE